MQRYTQLLPLDLRRLLAGRLWPPQQRDLHGLEEFAGFTPAPLPLKDHARERRERLMAAVFDGRVPPAPDGSIVQIQEEHEIKRDLEEGQCPTSDVAWLAAVAGRFEVFQWAVSYDRESVLPHGATLYVRRAARAWRPVDVAVYWPENQWAALASVGDAPRLARWWTAVRVDFLALYDARWPGLGNVALKAAEESGDRASMSLVKRVLFECEHKDYWRELEEVRYEIFRHDKL